MASLRALFDKSMHCDVTLNVGEHKILCHKLLLAANSPVWSAQFYSSSAAWADSHQVDIQGIDACVLEMVVKFFYGHKLLISVDNVMDIFQIADRYQIASCLQQCKKFLNADSTWKSKHICLLLDRAIHNKLDSCITQCLTKLGAAGSFDGEIFSSGSHFLKMSEHSMSVLLNADGIDAKEEVIWEGLLFWIDHTIENMIEQQNKSVKRRRIDVDQERKRLLCKMKPYIRFGLIEPAYFAKFIIPMQFLTHDEISEVSLFYLKQQAPSSTFKTEKRWVSMKCTIVVDK